jgi:hypothetical protein
METSTRVVIVGGGAAGIAAANALRKRGYTNTLILEKQQDIGGKCKTVLMDGQPLDTGAVYILPNYPAITRLAREAGAHLVESFPFEHLRTDGAYAPFGLPQPPFVTKALEYGRLGIELLKNFAALYRPLGQWNASMIRHLAEPFGTWMKKHRLDYFQRGAYSLLRSFGFGYEAQQIPAAYVINIFTKLARGGNLLALWDVPSVRMYHVEEGYGELLKRLASAVQVELGVEINSIERRPAGGGLIHTARGDFEFDKLIIACPLPATLNFLDVSPEETALFSKIQSFGVWQIAARVEGVRDAIILDENQTIENIGSTMILFRYPGESNFYYLFGYECLDSVQTDQEILQSARDTIRKLGGQIVGDAQLTRWAGYFPHYNSTEFALGYHQRLEALQGLRSTYYTGEILANIGVESACTYSEKLIQTYFS